MQSIQSLLEVCNHASKEANESIKDLVGKREAYKSVYMGADGTHTRLIDDRAEKAIFEVLKSYGNCRILSEEYGEYIPDKKPEITFVIDPLDGTYNASHGIPFYSTSIAVGNADLSSIYFGYVKNLCTGDIYHAYKGRGAYLNGKTINTSSRKMLKNFSISLYGYHNNVEDTLELSRKVRRVRILGSVALELCYVACGKLDAFVDIRNSLRLIDVAAGKLILEETNGKVTNGKGTELYLQDSVVNRLSMIASNGHAHRDILNFVGRKDESK